MKPESFGNLDQMIARLVQLQLDCHNGRKGALTAYHHLKKSCASYPGGKIDKSAFLKEAKQARLLDSETERELIYFEAGLERCEMAYEALVRNREDLAKQGANALSSIAAARELIKKCLIYRTIGVLIILLSMRLLILILNQ